MIAKALLLLWWLILVPFLSGFCYQPLLPREKQTPAVFACAGWLTHIALFEVTAVCFLIFGNGRDFYLLTNVFAVCSVLTALAGLFFAYRAGKEGLFRTWRMPEKPERSTLLFWMIFLALLLFQLYMAYTRASFDGDDAYYVVQGLTAQEMGEMYTRVPYTGQTTPVDLRHAMAVVPLWEAFIGRMCDIHVTRLVHGILPFFLIPFSYLLVAQVASALFREEQKRGMLPRFLSLYALLQMFGSVSIYTAERFFLTRTWQGKSMLANIAVPMAFWIMTVLYPAGEEERVLLKTQRAPWIWLALLHLLAGFCTSIGVMLVAALTIIYGIFLSVASRMWKPFVRTLCCAGTAFAYVAVYLLL